MARTYLVVWREDLSGDAEGWGTDLVYELRDVLSTWPNRSCAHVLAQASRSAQLVGDLHDPETGRFVGRVVPSGAVQLESSP